MKTPTEHYIIFWNGFGERLTWADPETGKHFWDRETALKLLPKAAKRNLAAQVWKQRAGATDELVKTLGKPPI
jgi:hypothetical protein